MDNCQSKQRYDRPLPPPETQKKLDLCEEEAADLTLREIRCPRCNFVIDKVFSDAKGHFLSKCHERRLFPKTKRNQTPQVKILRR